MIEKTRDRNLRRKRRVSSIIHGDDKRPRISIHKSNLYIYAQAIDDIKQHTLAAISSVEMAKDKAMAGKKRVELSFELGKKFADVLKGKKITTAVFDRGYNVYKGNVKAFAEGLRENGITI